ncbi:hypothetical protein AB0395_31425 [Streptosporangium sp. NPDC051023]|uniref:hypothetical protein n=1 Tax=Streptosporangium sp. NPDC051023 TaxID=3155410 RepID=UPI00344EB0F0
MVTLVNDGLSSHQQVSFPREPFLELSFRLSFFPAASLAIAAVSRLSPQPAGTFPACGVVDAGEAEDVTGSDKDTVGVDDDAIAA